MRVSKGKVVALLFLCCGSCSLQASYFSSVDNLNIAYDLSGFTLPTTPGAVTDWAAVESMSYTVVADSNTESYISTQIGGRVLGDGVTWITTNEGVGVQFKLTDLSGCLPEATQPPYDMALPAGATCLNSAIQVSYRLVRLADFVPSGSISMPSVQLLFNNYAGAPVATLRPMYYSGATNQPAITPCVIDTPSVVRLDDLPSANLQTGAMNMKNVPVTFSRCPGAISNIRYLVLSPYGPHDNATGTINTKPGSASGVYFQLLRSTAEPYNLSLYYDLPGYNGSGDYSVPLNIAYYIDDPAQVTLGDVESIVTLVVNYQ